MEHEYAETEPAAKENGNGQNPLGGPPVAAFGMRPQGVMFYLADHVDDGRLQTQPGPGGRG